MLRHWRTSPAQLLGALFPAVRWSRRYTAEAAVGDLIAGVTIALTLIPQSIAYASLAGLEPQFGLYASFVGGFVYALMGTCPQINIGPTALLSLLTFSYTNGTGPEFVVLLCFVGGIVQLAAGVARLGFLVDFVSLPVVSGFTSAAAVTIASSQLKSLLGLRFSSESFVGAWAGVARHVGDTRLPDTLLSLVCCIVLIGMKALKDIKIKSPSDPKRQAAVSLLGKGLWFAGVARNAVVVVLAAVVAYCVHEDRDNPLLLTGHITPGLPLPRAPPFTARVGNTTYSGGEMLAHLGSGLLVVPLVGILANVAIAKAFANGKTLDATQEVIALGVSNIVGAFFSSLPVNGSFTRSAVSDASGVRTPAAGVYTGVIVLLTLSLLTPFFYFIPRAALAAVIVCAVLHMVDVAIVARLWRTRRLDLIPLFGTFLCCLGLGIEVGLVCGVVIDILLVMYKSSKPPLDIICVDDGILTPHYAIHPVGHLNYAGAERIRSKLSSLRKSNKFLLEKVTKPSGMYDLSTEINPNDRIQQINTDSGNGVVKISVTDEEGHEVVQDTERDDFKSPNNDNELDKQTSEATKDNSHNVDVSCCLSEEEDNEKNNIVGVTHIGTKVTPREDKVPDLIVIFCDSLHSIDYTVLESLKLVVSEWGGRVVWCAARGPLRRQLDAAMPGLVHCNTGAELTRTLTAHGAEENGSTQL